MTTDIERQFFDTFGIEPKNIFKGCSLGAKFYSEICKEPCKGCKNEIRETIYSQITDRIYLMLLATLTCVGSIEFPFSDIQELKEDILEEVIKHQYGFDKHQVQALFKESR